MERVSVRKKYFNNLEIDNGQSISKKEVFPSNFYNATYFPERSKTPFMTFSDFPQNKQKN